MITELPVPWGPLPDPFTLAGDAAWTDYTVSADVRFLTAAPAAVMGRIDSADVFQDGKARWPSGYVLRLKPDGAWELLSAEFKKPAVTLASGSARIDRSQWHRLELRFHGEQIVGLAGRSAAGYRGEFRSHARHVRAGNGMESHPVR